MKSMSTLMAVAILSAAVSGRGEAKPPENESDGPKIIARASAVRHELETRKVYVEESVYASGSSPDNRWKKFKPRLKPIRTLKPLVVEPERDCTLLVTFKAGGVSWYDLTYALKEASSKEEVQRIQNSHDGEIYFALFVDDKIIDKSRVRLLDNYEFTSVMLHGIYPVRPGKHTITVKYYSIGTVEPRIGSYSDVRLSVVELSCARPKATAAMATSLRAEPQPPAIETVWHALTVDLRDGSRLLGRPLDFQALPLDTSTGKLKIPLAQLKSFEMKDDKESAMVELCDGGRLSGTVGLNAFPLQTSIGKLDVPLAEVASCQVDVAAIADGNVALASAGATVSGEFMAKHPGSNLIDGNTTDYSTEKDYAASKVPSSWVVTLPRTIC